jgi:hypothetical protein
MRSSAVIHRIIPYLSLMLFFVSAGWSDMRPRVELTALGNTLEIRFDFSRINDGQWREFLAHPDQIQGSGYGLSGQSGSPALPIFTELIEIQDMMDPSFVLLKHTSHHLTDPNITMTPEARLESDAPVEIQAYPWPASASNHALDIQLGEPQKMMGRQYLPITLSPVSINGTRQELSVPGEIVIQLQGVNQANSEGFNALRALRSEIPESDIYQHLGHYLIITPPVFEPYVQYLTDWKRRKGHPVTVVTTDEAGQTPTAVKAFIQDAYDTWDEPPEYILLIGDEDMGIGGFYVYNPDNEALVTDHPYALLDGDDSFPEAWVGRLSVDTISELGTVISKILSYESNPEMSDPGWFQRALLVCTVSAAISPQQVNNWIGRKLVENGFTEIDTAYYPMQTSLFFIRNPIDNGVGFVNYRGLGAWDHWIGPYFYNSDIDQLHNGFMLPIMTSIVCGGGNYASSVDPVFGEKWIRAGTSSVPKGAVAFIGPSEVHTHTQFNNVIDIALYSALFDLGMNELGPALWYAKLELWRNYYQSEFLPFGQSAEFYHNVYNILGDPGMSVWTDVPKTIVVDLPESLHADDTHISITIHDEAGSAVEDAFVFLFNAENAIGLRSDAAGEVSLPVNAVSGSDLQLTITGKNLKPVLETIPIAEASHDFSLSHWAISPDGLLKAGSAHSLDLQLTNNTTQEAELSLVLASSSPACLIQDSSFDTGSIASGASLNLEGIFAWQVDPSARHGDIVDLDILAISQGDTTIWKHSFPIQATQLMISNITSPTALIAGDSAAFELSLENRGGLSAPPMTLTFLEHPLLSFQGNPLVCPGIAIDDLAIISGLSVHFSDQLFPGEVLQLTVVAAGAGRSDTLTYPVTVEALNQFAPSLPDAYGYRVFDDMDVSYSMAPTYQWVEIDPNLGGAGARLPLYDNYEENDKSRLVELPFDVTYYGQSYSSATICSNGWMALGASPELSFYNRVIPSPSGPNAMIAPFWDDLITGPGGISTLMNPDSIIVEWSMMSHLEVSSTLNFQVIIYSSEYSPSESGDNLIKMQFKDYFNYDTFANFSTTGIESPDYTTGLQVGYNNLTETSVGTLRSGQALLFTTDRGIRYPAPQMEMNQLDLNFVENPWVVTTDSIMITNTGGSALVYRIDPVDEPGTEQAPNPLAGQHFVKGGPEPDGRLYPNQTRDLFDYDWVQNGEPGGPVFSWQNISQPQYELVFPGDPDDSSMGPFGLGFDFPFFSESYSQFYFSSNGSISFTSNAYPWLNLPLPNGSAPPAMIAPWWDDLNNNDGIQGVPYYWTNEVDTAIVTWDNFPKFGTDDRHTFQLIMVSNGDILLQYLEMEGTSTSSTVGIQNIHKNKGLQVCYNSANGIDDGTAILIHRQSSWLAVNDWTGVVLPGESAAFEVTVDTRYLEPGSFSVPLLLRSNAGNLSQAPINIHLDVIHGTLPRGDVNGDYQINIVDLTALIDFTLEIESADDIVFTRCDLDGDGSLTILDAIICLEIIL